MSKLKVGDKVRILTNPIGNMWPIGSELKILQVWSKVPFPYEVGDDEKYCLYQEHEIELVKDPAAMNPTETLAWFEANPDGQVIDNNGCVYSKRDLSVTDFMDNGPFRVYVEEARELTWVQINRALTRDGYFLSDTSIDNIRELLGFGENKC